MTSKLQIYETAAAFLEKMRPLFMVHEAKHGLILGITERLVQHPDQQGAPPYLATVEDAEGVVVAGVILPPHGLVLYSERTAVADALTRLADDLARRGWVLPDVHGINAISTQFAEIWAVKRGCRREIKMRQRAFELRQVIHPRYSAGEMRPATELDLALGAQWACEFGVETFGEPTKEERQEIRAGTARRIRDGFLYLWVDGEPVSMVGLTRPTARGISIAPVYTPPALRGRGYASSCVARLSQQMLDSDKEFCALFTDLANPTSNSIYQKIGYQPVGDFSIHRFV